MPTVIGMDTTRGSRSHTAVMRGTDGGGEGAGSCCSSRLRGEGGQGRAVVSWAGCGTERGVCMPARLGQGASTVVVCTKCQRR